MWAARVAMMEGMRTEWVETTAPLLNLNFMERKRRFVATFPNEDKYCALIFNNFMLMNLLQYAFLCQHDRLDPPKHIAHRHSLVHHVFPLHHVLRKRNPILDHMGKQDGKSVTAPAQ
ncbi:unnamed protein product [Agarophyton chilense]